MARKKKEIPFLPYGAGLFALLLYFDQYTKYLVVEFPLGESRVVFDWLSITYVQNTGILWGQLTGANSAMIWLSIAAFGVLLYYHDEFTTTMEKISYVLLLSGIWGNLLDRMLRGFVVDFIDLGWWPIFNISDSAICVGIVLYLLEQYRQNSFKSSSLSK